MEEVINEQEVYQEQEYVFEEPPLREPSEEDKDSKKMTERYQLDLLDLLMFLKTDDNVLKANTAGYIQHLAFNDDATKHRIRELDIIPLLVKLLGHEDEDCHRNAAGALKNLSFGRFMDDNKLAIQEAEGVSACTKLLYRTSWIEVREHVTGVLYNMSSVQQIKVEILEEAMEAVALLIVIPLSGWEKEHAQMSRSPGVVTWSALLRNSTGVLRNTSSAGSDARERMRGTDGLVDALLWILRAAINQDKNDIDNKIVENCVCTLRNLSYHIDREIDRDLYADAIVQVNETSEPSSKSGSKQSSRRQSKEKLNSPDLSTRGSPRGSANGSASKIPTDAVRTGCIRMKKKPFAQRKKPKTSKGSAGQKLKNSTPPPETETLLIPVNADGGLPHGLELLWQPDTVTIYIFLLTNSTNPVTLEASAAAIHNLCGCSWKWASLLRVHVRLERGLPPMADLLTIDQEYVIRAIAYALRNLAINLRNKWSIGKYAMKEIVGALPKAKTLEAQESPSDFTILAALSCLQVLTHQDLFNSKYVCENLGVQKLVALTREKDNKNSDKPLRCYPEKVILEANRVLLYMWQFKECRELIKKEMWSYNKANDAEKTFRNETLRNPQHECDVYADMELEEKADFVADRDDRRYLTVDGDSYGAVAGQSASETSLQRPQQYEMEYFGDKDDRDTPESQYAKVNRSGKDKKSNKWGSGDDRSKLVNGDDDSYV